MAGMSDEDIRSSIDIFAETTGSPRPTVTDRPFFQLPVPTRIPQLIRPQPRMPTRISTTVITRTILNHHHPKTIILAESQTPIPTSRLTTIARTPSVGRSKVKNYTILQRLYKTGDPPTDNRFMFYQQVLYDKTYSFDNNKSSRLIFHDLESQFCL